ncbi:tagaturonate reductase [Flavobacterium sp. SOK18b]|nr:tagaturonate reductase [Flavobacterium sp. SOK18b]MBB1193127.1 tagaturonate reductase [Flavobacterium sp. SOK18b]
MNLNRKNTNLEVLSPIKVVQFGEGNFLRAFVDYAFQELNDSLEFNAGIAVVQPIENGMVDLLNNQDGLYTLFLKGLTKGQEIQEKKLITNLVTGINPYVNFQDFLALAKEQELQFVISNTTESGIAYVSSDTPSMQPPSSYPAKLTLLLYERFKFFNGDPSKGLCIIPCELINNNADTLKEFIIKYSNDWNLGIDFIDWVNQNNSFHNTLVDRIVPGYPRTEIEEYNNQLEYTDNLIVTAETFFLWVIEGGDALRAKLPFHKTSLDVKIVDDMQPYRTRKVRILNGAHTAMVPFSLLFGNETVKQTVDHTFTGSFVNDAIFKEINETIAMDKVELDLFAEDVLDRFRNPFIKHNLSSIALNSIDKFKVRVLPSIVEYVKKLDKTPINLTFSFACLIRFYQGTWNGEKLPLDDNPEIITFFDEIWKTNSLEEVVQKTLSNINFWGQDLNAINGLYNDLVLALTEIEKNGIEKGYANFSQKK